MSPPSDSEPAGPSGGGEIEHSPEEVVDGHPVEPVEPRRRTQRLGLDVGVQQSRYTSPLPSPDDLDRYVQHLPDAAERLLAAGEREQAHRHQIENRLASIDEDAMPRFYDGQKRAHYIGLILGLVYLGAMVVAILEGYPLAGAGGAAFGIAAMIWATRRDSNGPDGPPVAKPDEQQQDEQPPS